MGQGAQLTVVVITHNRVAEADHTVARMRALPEVARLIVIDNASTDDTRSRLRARYPDLLVVPLCDNLGAAARNIGVRLAATPYVALCDDDTWWQPGSLARAVSIMESAPRVAMLTARVVVEPEGCIDPTCLRMARSPLDSIGLPGATVLGFLAGAVVARRSAFLASGGFDPRFFLGREEGLLSLDLAARGWFMLYVHDLIVHHRPSTHRNVRQRRCMLLRNGIYLAWLRLPFPAACAETLRTLRAAKHEGVLAEVCASAARALPWLLAERRPIPDAVERARRLVERSEDVALRQSLRPLPGTVR
jgi:GT2 family glycosyltransferase